MRTPQKMTAADLSVSTYENSPVLWQGNAVDSRNKEEERIGLVWTYTRTYIPHPLSRDGRNPRLTSPTAVTTHYTRCRSGAALNLLLMAASALAGDRSELPEELLHSTQVAETS